MHVGIIGSGRLGRTIAYTLLHEWYIEELSLVDIIPGVASSTEKEMRHVAASLGRYVEISSYENASELGGADIILVTAGRPRTADMTRRDLAEVNGRIIRRIAEEVYPRNKGCRFLIVTNPVDAMATLFRRVVGGGFVLSTGTHLDSVRFRSELAERLGVPSSSVEAYVGGEHGPASVFLWSLTRIEGARLEEYGRLRGAPLDKDSVERSVKGVAREIIANLGATLYGPSAAFRDIVRAILLNTGRIMSVASPVKFGGVPTEVNVSIPQKVGRSLGPTLLHVLSEGEKAAIREAAKSIYATYSAAARSAGIED